MRSALGLDELRGDTHPRARLAHAALQEIGRAEALADRTEVLIPVLHREGRGPADDAQAVHLREHVEDLLGDSVGEVLLVLLRAHVGEGEDGDGRRHSGGGRPPRAAPPERTGGYPPPTAPRRHRPKPGTAPPPPARRPFPG